MCMSVQHYCLVYEKWSFDDSSYFFFFFKQKTAYEMRISDWSSDVCSSDLHRQALHQRLAGIRLQQRAQAPAERDEDLPVMQGAVRLCEQRRVVLRGVAHRKVMKNDVVMIVFETAGRWQDEVGETRGFVAIAIDRYHAVETAEREIGRAHV